MDKGSADVMRDLLNRKVPIVLQRLSEAEARGKIQSTCRHAWDNKTRQCCLCGLWKYVYDGMRDKGVIIG
jgi:hypothetical protein